MDAPRRLKSDFQAQIITGSNHMFDTTNLELLQIRDKARKQPVAAIIGNQSTGKSTFCNQCFETSLEVLESARMQPTTHGATLCALDDLYLLDFEGSNSSEGSALIENRLALFAFYVSDIVLVNINAPDLGARNSPLSIMLTTVLSARLKIGREVAHRTFIIALLRNPVNINSEADIADLRAQALEFFEETWKKLPKKEEGLSFSQVFDFDAIPLRYDRKKLNRDDLGNVRIRIRERNQDVQTDLNWISSHWEKAWSKILKDQTLDTPDFQLLVEKDRLLAIFWELKEQLLQPCKYQVSKTIFFDTNQALEKIKADFIERIEVSRWSKNALDYIKTVIKNDLRPILEEWKRSDKFERSFNWITGVAAATAVQVSGAIAATAKKHWKYILLGVVVLCVRGYMLGPSVVRLLMVV